MQRRFTTPRSDQTPDPEPDLHPHPPGADAEHDPLPPQGLPSGSNSSSGIASNTPSRAVSCCPFVPSGGERAGAITGAVVRSPTCSSICRTVVGSVTSHPLASAPTYRRLWLSPGILGIRPLHWCTLLCRFLHRASAKGTRLSPLLRGANPSSPLRKILAPLCCWKSSRGSGAKT